MVITLGATWRVRGGVSAVAGFILLGLGVVTEIAAIATPVQYSSNVEATWLPLPSLAIPVAFAMVGLAAGACGGGLLLSGYAITELRREELLRLDPLDYPPRRHPGRKWVPVAVVVVVALVASSLWVVPVAHSFRQEIPVGSCTASNGPSAVLVNLPADATLSYEWNSSDGAPVSEVYAPDGPPVSPQESVGGDLFTNSSSGYSVVQSNGSAIPFWACDLPTIPGSSAGRTVLLSGTYYTPLL